MAAPVTFAHISDTHFGHRPAYVRDDRTPEGCARNLVAALNALPFTLDFVVHTGDVVSVPEMRDFAQAAETFGGLRAPLYFVNGNHDGSGEILRRLPMPPRRDLSGGLDLLSYAFDVRGHRFLVVDACGPEELGSRGLLSSAQLAVLDREVAPDGPPLTVFCHFLPLAVGVRWIDDTMLIANGDELHRRLVGVGRRLRGVFVGHIHQSLTVVRDGVLYSAATSAYAPLAGDPTDPVAREDALAPPGYAIVQITDRQVVVRPYALPWPGRPSTE